MMPDFTPIAVTGLGCTFPDAPNIAQFWDNLLHSRSACDTVPADRWIAPADDMAPGGFSPDKALSRRACLIREFQFDPDGFRVPPHVLTALDPLYHILLHASRDAVNDGRLTNVDPARITTILAAIEIGRAHV